MIFNILTVLILIVCVLLILIVLVQNSKGGGLASSFASNNQIVGVRKTADFLEKATWVLVAVLLGLSLLSSTVIPRDENRAESRMEEQIQSAPSPQTGAPVLPDVPEEDPGQ
ncbi:MAG: preprotein translocase subunit SecG [Flavobacteriales bacterium]|nr:preprotein translocase subunit SecG [Flavobacteriales bacterium]